jgi:hypothetical protein
LEQDQLLVAPGAELHHAACAQARPDPEELAERLFRRELGSGWEAFLGPAAIYADLEALVRDAVARKWASHRTGRPDFVRQGRRMSMIGG